MNRHQFHPLQSLVACIGPEPIESELVARIGSLNQRLVDLHEAFRNDPRAALTTFISDAHRAIVLRNKAESRLKAVSPEASVPVRPEPAAELLAMIQSASLRREAAIATLRAERLRLIDVTRSRLVETVSGIESIAILYRDPNSSLGVTPEQRAAGDSEELDGALGRLAPLVADQLRLTRHLDALDGLDGIGPQIAAAVEASGGKGSVIKAVVKAHGVLPDPGAEQAAQSLGAVEARLKAIDPESQLAAVARAELEAAEERLAKAQAESAASRTKAAFDLVDRAIAGDIEATRRLLSVATGPLQAALDAARGNEAQLVGALSVMTAAD